MDLLTFVLLFFVANAYAVKKRDVDVADVIKDKMLGIETVHDMKIDRNTIISHNKVEQRNLAKKAEQNRDPDWSYNAIPSVLSSYVTDFKRNMSECLKEIQQKDKRKVKPLSPIKDSPIHGECLIACVLKRNGVIENKKIRKENLISLVKKFFEKDHTMIKKLEKNLDRCIEISVQAEEECAMAAKLNDCTNDLMIHNKRKLTINF
ncbi:uncharacterized protein LOC128678616 [Plodia interpunctella]|uniref:uncharacterized protein LOC128678616 n=1 Tax=Plodia interpunctella TaxID=58824 RepID=UPI002368A01F|nr:uncharacterized protein LOC128678616 [Plodia interpunctella]